MIKYRLIAIACWLAAVVLYSSTAPRPFGAILFGVGVCFEFAAWRTWKKGSAAKRSA
jgi:hypothetical protein